MGQFRDVIIIISGTLFIITFILFAMLGLKLYSKVKIIRKHAQSIELKLDTTTQTVQEFTGFVSSDLRAVIETVGLIRGLRTESTKLFSKRGDRISSRKSPENGEG